MSDPRPRLPLAAELAAVAFLGALQTVAYVQTRWAWPLQLAAVALFASRIFVAPGARRAAALGLAFGTAWLVAGTWWLFVSMHFYGGLPAWMAALAVLALSAFLSLDLALAMAFVTRLLRSGAAAAQPLAPAQPLAAAQPLAVTRPIVATVAFAAAWLLAEWLRGWLFTGFPWVASGYAHVDSPLAGFAPWLGVVGIGALSAALAASLGALLVRPGRRRAAAVAGVWIAVLAVGAGLGRIDFTQPTSRLAVSLLQGNVPQHEKFERRFLPEQLAWVQARLGDAKGTLVVGPETVIPLLPFQLEAGWWAQATAPFRSGARGLLVGLPLGSPEAGYTNSVAGVSAATAGLPDGRYRYDKHHLVPFGEFIPTGFKWFTRMMNIPLGDFERGPVVPPSFPLAGERIAPNVCYEDLFGEELAARFAGAGDRPTLLANVTNIGWFGRTVALDQHLHISRMRTLELQRPMLRATNTGTTAVIDHRGVVRASLDVFTQGVLESSVEGRDGTTPFAWWAGRFGLWPLVAAALVALAGVALAVAKPRIARPR